MENAIISALGDALGCLASHVKTVGVMNTDEATFRSFFMASLMERRPGARCQSEWFRFDLLVQAGDLNALVEFKYYISRRTIGLDGKPGQWKGEAGPGNEGEFWACVRKLRERSDESIHHKYLILIYERPYERKSKYSFTRSYDSLGANDDLLGVRDIGHALAEQLTCKLITVA